ncbi:MAG: ABC transporter permease [Rhodocyclaceae bacterium]|jgi:ABC-2 type transport system permease protein|nr:ABC transporter permease [Rhodocyclaceae bacterium]MCA3060557.1 ABC transporter permease [Rhodocyclaceae bacterium]MCA3081234.1 ABC transporter permease [Rhodocyclaceae bacterium]
MNIISTLVRKDVLLYLQNRKAIVITLIAPIVMAAFFGYVFNSSSNTKPARTPIALVDLDNTKLTAAVVAKFQADETLNLLVTNEEEAVNLVRSGKRRAAIVLPKDFSRDLEASMSGAAAKPAIRIKYDPSQAFVVGLVNGLIGQHVMRAIASSRSAQSAQALSLPFDASASAVTANNEKKYNSFAHSFAGMSVQFILFMGIEFGIGLLLMRRQDIWKRLRIAPITRVDMIASRVIASSMIGMGFVSAIYVVAIGVFGVRVSGSWIGFVAIILSFAILNASFGLLIAAIGRSPEVARSIAIFATLIMVMLGGAWVPSFVFPEWLQTISQLTPTYWAIEGLSAMTWRGLGLEAAITPVVVMLGFSAAFTALAMQRFQWDE